MYGHIRKMAEAEKAGIEAAGGSATLLQIKETLPEEVLQKMGAAGAKDSSIPVLDNPDDLRMLLQAPIFALQC
jgi:NAD(P)H dehydrogenase (quinone)